MLAICVFFLQKSKVPTDISVSRRKEGPSDCAYLTCTSNTQASIFPKWRWRRVKSSLTLRSSETFYIYWRFGKAYFLSLMLQRIRIWELKTETASSSEEPTPIYPPRDIIFHKSNWQSTFNIQQKLNMYVHRLAFPYRIRIFQSLEWIFSANRNKF